MALDSHNSTKSWGSVSPLFSHKRFVFISFLWVVSVAISGFQFVFSFGFLTAGIDFAIKTLELDSFGIQLSRSDCPPETSRLRQPVLEQMYLSLL